MKPNYAPLWKWARIREQARVCKEAGKPFPWVDDPIISKYRFCNVRREDDKVTRWIDKNIRRKFAGHKDLWFMLCIARVINWPDTLRVLIDHDLPAWPDTPQFEPKYLAYVLNDRAYVGCKVFTGAYTITAPPTKGESKADFVARSTLGKLWEDRQTLRQYFSDPVSMRSCHSLLMEYPGWGNFMAYQAIVDMRFTDILNAAPDTETWAAAGPGTIRGLNRLHGRELNYHLSQNDALPEILEIYELYPEALNFDIDLSDVPNMLCETDKYLRVLNGEGTPRCSVPFIPMKYAGNCIR
jgi:hypothetical protein